MTEVISKKGFAFHELQDTFKGLKLLRKLPTFKVEVSSLNFDYCCFQLHFFGFHRDVTCYPIVVQEGDAIFLPSQWIHFVCLCV